MVSSLYSDSKPFYRGPFKPTACSETGKEKGCPMAIDLSGKWMLKSQHVLEV